MVRIEGPGTLVVLVNEFPVTVAGYGVGADVVLFSPFASQVVSVEVKEPASYPR
jgi:hypothetical protein